VIKPETDITYANVLLLPISTTDCYQKFSCNWTRLVDAAYLSTNLVPPCPCISRGLKTVVCGSEAFESVGESQPLSSALEWVIWWFVSALAIPVMRLGSTPFSRRIASYSLSFSSSTSSFASRVLRDGFRGREMHWTLCLMQEPHGFCRSHLTLRSKQRIQEKADFEEEDEAFMAMKGRGIKETGSEMEKYMEVMDYA
jgi:hypothetical protein